MTSAYHSYPLVSQQRMTVSLPKPTSPLTSFGLMRPESHLRYVCCNCAQGDAIGVAVADRPEGPYRDPIGKPLAVGASFIDPTVFVDDDGRAYLFWGNKGCWYGELNADMVSFKDGWREIPGFDDEKCFGPKGGHGYGSRRTGRDNDAWPELAATWLKRTLRVE